jgi:hypothetical protein
MSDSYLAISGIANDANVTERMRASGAQQAHLGNAPAITDPIQWVADNRYIWAASPGWGEAWDFALASHPDNPNYQPGADPAVITDAMILATVQELGAA